MTPRPSISKTRRARVFQSNGGVCHLCSGKIMPGEEWEVEHVQARGLGGSDDDDNLRPAHSHCHKSKSRAERSIMAKADAQHRAGTPFAPRPKKKKIPSRPFGKSRPFPSRSITKEAG